MVVMQFFFFKWSGMITMLIDHSHHCDILPEKINHWPWPKLDYLGDGWNANYGGGMQSLCCNWLDDEHNKNNTDTDDPRHYLLASKLTILVVGNTKTILVIFYFIIYKRSIIIDLLMVSRAWFLFSYQTKKFSQGILLDSLNWWSQAWSLFSHQTKKFGCQGILLQSQLLCQWSFAPVI